jgi:acetyl esterase/lipase
MGKTNTENPDSTPAASGPAVYRGFDQAALDAGYNNSLAVVRSPEILRDYEVRSAALRRALPARVDLRYGPALRQRIDYFAPEPVTGAAARPGGAPLLVFIHGGYWQMRAKEGFSFLAAGPLARGFHVALVGYTLAPEATLSGIAAEIRNALAWLRAQAGAYGADVDRLVVSGWSAGGHLAALALDAPGVIGGLAISGIYDLAPIRLSYLNERLRLSPAEVDGLSPLRLPLSPRPLLLAVGGAELPELQRQTFEFAQARQGLPGGVQVLSGDDHFTVLEALAQPEGALARALDVFRT